MTRWWAILLLGCTASKPTTTTQEACAAEASAHCARLAACRPYAFAVFYADEPNCRALRASVCGAIVAKNGTSADAIKSCADALTSCTAMRAPGRDCMCGLSTVVADLGAACGSCGNGLVCIEGKCSLGGQEGESCMPWTGDTGSKPPPNTCGEGLGCSAMGKCTPVPPVALGQRCQSFVDACAGGHCVSNVCVAYVGFGAKCGSSGDGSCLPPLTCSQGVCSERVVCE